MIAYSIRFDDPGQQSPHTFEVAVFDLLRKHGICSTVAVIPAHEREGRVVSLERTDVPHLIAAHRDGLIEIAQHGYAHISIRKHGANLDSEFSGVAESEQYTAIAAGRAILEEVFETKIAGFVPPWNTYDDATLRALSQLGFDYISAGWEHTAHNPGIISIPRTCNIWELKAALIKARKYLSRQPRIIAVMHHYDFKEANPETGRFTLAELDTLFAWLSQQNDVTCEPLSAVAKKIHADAEAWLSFHRNRAKLPWLIRKHVPREMLMKASFFRVLLSAVG